MLLSIIVYLIFLVIFTFIVNRIINFFCGPNIITLIGTSVFFIIFIFSPMYIEFPGSYDAAVAVIKNNNVSYKPYGVIEPLVNGIVVRMPLPGIESRDYVGGIKFNRFISIQSFEITYKITNADEFVKAWFDNRKDNNEVIFITREFIQKINDAVINYIISDIDIKKTTSDNEAKEIIIKMRKNLQKMIDEKKGGVIITSFKISKDNN